MDVVLLSVETHPDDFGGPFQLAYLWLYTYICILGPGPLFNRNISQKCVQYNPAEVVQLAKHGLENLPIFDFEATCRVIIADTWVHSRGSAVKFSTPLLNFENLIFFFIICSSLTCLCTYFLDSGKQCEILETWFNGRLDSVRLMVVLDCLKGLFHLKWSYEIAFLPS